jgi:hypothetical protein
MNPMRRAVASVLRLVGAGLIGLGFVLLTLAWVARHKQPVTWWAVAAEGGLIALGVFLLLRSKAWAARWTEDFED